MINTIFKSDPSLFNLKDSRLFNRAVMLDSIFKKFPYAECILPDRSGQILNSFSFLDKLNIEFGFEIDDNPLFTHDYYIRNTEFFKIPLNKIITSNIKYIMDSRHIKNDECQSRSFEGTLSSIVTENIVDFKFNNTKITTTDLIDYFYQPEITFFEFIDNYINNAFTKQYETSPFIWFINSANKFYFVALDDLVNESSANIPTFKLEANPGQIYEDTIVRGITDGGYIGLKFKLANNDSCILNDEATIIVDTNLVSDYYQGVGTDKYLFRSSDTLIKYDFDIDYGITVESDTNNEYYQAYLNSKYLKSYFPLRLKLFVQYSDLSKICSGEKINLDIYDTDETLSSIFSGKWTILESQHIKDQKDVFHSSLLIGKHTTKLPSTHKFKNDYI